MDYPNVKKALSNEETEALFNLLNWDGVERPQIIAPPLNPNPSESVGLHDHNVVVNGTQHSTDISESFQRSSFSKLCGLFGWYRSIRQLVTVDELHA